LSLKPHLSRTYGALVATLFVSGKTGGCSCSAD
jgi:hypothetical protein